MVVANELAINISYPTSASGIIVLWKTPTKYREFFPTLFVKTTDFQLVFDFEQTRTGYHIWIAWYNGSYIMIAKPIRALELHYPMIQILIKRIRSYIPIYFALYKVMLCYMKRKQTQSPDVRESWLPNPRNFCMWNLESAKFDFWSSVYWAFEFETQLKKSRISLMIGFSCTGRTHWRGAVKFLT